MTKKCTKCGEIKPATLEYFYRNKRIKGGLVARCKVCTNKDNIAYVKTEKGRKVVKKAYTKFNQSEKGKLSALKNHLEKRYGITLEQYDEMFENQNGVCMICGGTNADGCRLYVDHDHKTNEIRGLLCFGCNRLLGDAKDNIIILQSTINYLKK